MRQHILDHLLVLVLIAGGSIAGVSYLDTLEDPALWLQILLGLGPAGVGLLWLNWRNQQKPKDKP